MISDINRIYTRKNNTLIEITYYKNRLFYASITKYSGTEKLVSITIHFSDNNYKVYGFDYINWKPIDVELHNKTDLLLERISKYIGRKITRTPQIVFSS